MNALRRNVLKGAAGAGTVAVAVAAGLLKPTLAMASAPRTAYEAKNVGDAEKAMGATGAIDSKEITIKAPDIAENGAVVPVEVTSAIPGTTSIRMRTRWLPTSICPTAPRALSQPGSRWVKLPWFVLW